MTSGDSRVQTAKRREGTTRSRERARSLVRILPSGMCWVLLPAGLVSAGTGFLFLEYRFGFSCQANLGLDSLANLFYRFLVDVSITRHFLDFAFVETIVRWYRLSITSSFSRSPLRLWSLGRNEIPITNSCLSTMKEKTNKNTKDKTVDSSWEKIKN